MLLFWQFALSPLIQENSNHPQEDDDNFSNNTYWDNELLL